MGTLWHRRLVVHFRRPRTVFSLLDDRHDWATQPGSSLTEGIVLDTLMLSAMLGISSLSSDDRGGVWAEPGSRSRPSISLEPRQGAVQPSIYPGHKFINCRIGWLAGRARYGAAILQHRLVRIADRGGKAGKKKRSTHVVLIKYVRCRRACRLLVLYVMISHVVEESRVARDESTAVYRDKEHQSHSAVSA